MLVSECNEEKVKALEGRMAELRAFLKFAHRAFVIEFAGTPKSGKSTSVEAIRHFFSRNGFQVHVLAERAALCPIEMKGHLFFNTWCASTMLAELLANVQARADIIIVDRGLFDALVWLILQVKRGELTDTEAATFKSFLLLGRWCKLIDLVVVMNVSAEQAIKRENAQRITPRPGRIMNKKILEMISNSVHEAFTKYGASFSAAIQHVTTDHTVHDSNVELAALIVDRLETFLNPDVLTAPVSVLAPLPLAGISNFSTADAEQARNVILGAMHCVRRSEAEIDSLHVQIIPCGVLTHKDGVVIFKRKEGDQKSSLYGKTAIFQATHVVCGTCGATVLEDSLFERIARSLHIGVRFPMHLIGYCWDRTDANSRHHFAMVYKVDISEATAVDLKNKEFPRWRDPSIDGEFIRWSDLENRQEELELEPWSKAILTSMLNEVEAPDGR